MKAKERKERIKIMQYQVMPELTMEEYAELKADIQERGVMVPIEFDENGTVLDGNNRLKICDELGITDFPKVIRAGMTAEQKLTHAWKLNLARRHLTQEQKRDLIRQQIKATPERSDRQIAMDLGVDHVTVGTQRKLLENGGEIHHQETLIDARGTVQPRERKTPVANQRHNLESTGEIHQLDKTIGADGKARTTAPQRPVSVWNPTPKESEAMKQPEIVDRMEKDEKLSVAGACKKERIVMMDVGTKRDTNKKIVVRVNQKTGVRPPGFVHYLREFGNGIVLDEFC